jgi:hypothetical protein
MEVLVYHLPENVLSPMLMASNSSTWSFYIVTESRIMYVLLMGAIAGKVISALLSTLVIVTFPTRT